MKVLVINAGSSSCKYRLLEMDDRRKEELLRQLDAIAEELQYLGVTAEDIAARYAGAGRPGKPGGKEEK